MQIVKSVQKKVCEDGAIWNEFTFDAPITSDLIDILSAIGVHEVALDIGSGFFKIYIEDCFLIRGFLDDYTLEMRFLPCFIDIVESFMRDLLSWFKSGGTDYAMMKRRAEEMREKIKEHQ